jgi:hypothetical protein
MTRLQRIVRRIGACLVLPAMLCAVLVNVGHADPTHRIVGYGGVLPLPVSHAPSAGQTAAGPGERILAQRHDSHPGHERVLYAAGRQPVAPVDSVAPRHTPCPSQRIAEIRSRTAGTPNS